MPILELNEAQLVRLDQLVRYLQDLRFPFPAPSNPNLLGSLAGGSTNLDFFDKFDRQRVEYRAEHVQPPASIYFRSFKGDNWQALNTKLCVAFGGTGSPSADAVWLTTLLAVIAHGSEVSRKGNTGLPINSTSTSNTW